MTTEKITKVELDQVTSKWLEEQDPDTFDNPVTRIAVQDEGEFDPQADAQKWAKALPDKTPSKPFVYGFVERYSN